MFEIAGDGFEPPFSRIWTLRDSASLSCDVHVWKNHFSTFTYWLLEEVTISPINSTHSELGYTFLRTALCFSYHQTFSLQTMGKIGIEPIMFTTRERFYRPPQHHQSLPLSHNPDSRVSNMFIVLCFPLDCFMLCQPHRVVSDIIMPFDFMFLENSLVINVHLWWLIETKKHSSDGKSDQAQAYAVTYLCSFWFTYAHPKVFSAHKTDGQHMEEMEILRFELRTSRLWAGRSNHWTKFPE